MSSRTRHIPGGIDRARCDERGRGTRRGVGERREGGVGSFAGGSIHLPALPRLTAPLFYETN